MKKMLILLFLIVTILGFNGNVFGQQTVITFRYDEAGNRELREVAGTKEKTNDNTNPIEANSILHKDGALIDAEAQADEAKEKDAEIAELGNTTISIFPNPTYGKLSISISYFDTESHIHLVITDEQGRMIETFKIKDPHTSFDLSTFPTGKYVFTLRTTSEEKSFVILKI